MNKTGCLALVVLAVLFCVLEYLDDFDTNVSHKCEVVGRVTIPGGYKSQGELVLALKDEKNRKFDLNVTASAYVEAATAKYLNFKISERDIDPHQDRPFIFTWLKWGIGVLFVILGFVMFIFGFIDD
jgi:hypothetical protein